MGIIPVSSLLGCDGRYGRPSLVAFAAALVCAVAFARELPARALGREPREVKRLGQYQVHVVGDPELKLLSGCTLLLTGPCVREPQSAPGVKDHLVEVTGQLLPQEANPTFRVTSWRVTSQPTPESVAHKDPTSCSAREIELEGAVIYHVLGKPTMKSEDGCEFLLVGELAGKLDKLPAIRKAPNNRVRVRGMAESGAVKPKIRLTSYEVLSTAGRESATVPQLETSRCEREVRLEGTVWTHIFTRPELRTADGHSYRLVGEQVRRLERAPGLKKSLVELTGFLEGAPRRQVVRVKSFRLRKGPGQ